MNDDDYNIWMDYGKGKDLYKVIDYDDYLTDSKYSKYADVLKEFSKKYSTKYVTDEKLYAIKKQIEWANKVYTVYGDILNSTETKLLKRVIETGTYKSSERALLNELLKKY